MPLSCIKQNHARSVSLGILNIVGLRQSDACGMVLPMFVKVTINYQPLTVYSADTQNRSFCSVTGVVGAIGKLMNSDESISQKIIKLLAHHLRLSIRSTLKYLVSF